MIGVQHEHCSYETTCAHQPSYDLALKRIMSILDISATYPDNPYNPYNSYTLHCMSPLSLHICPMSMRSGGAIEVCQWWDIMCCDTYWQNYCIWIWLNLLRASWKMKGYWIPPKTCNSGRLHNHHKLENMWVIRWGYNASRSFPIPWTLNDIHSRGVGRANFCCNTVNLWIVRRRTCSAIWRLLLFLLIKK